MRYDVFLNLDLEGFKAYFWKNTSFTHRSNNKLNHLIFQL